ncbi:CaiB/BaiF CoA transferase family protein [Actinophytocola sp.]|uniref:CaiB/BaiF CoA transferase family protein n=1 Tax=Actinophytocola sp. TaxID=1872138 RepID=UPI003D6AD706
MDGHDRAAPLSGVRVLDVSNLWAGPMVGMFLADFGADVVKVEHPDNGDELRRWGHSKNGVGLFYKVVNRNKRAITLHLRDPEGQRLLRRLVAGFDVVVENFRPGTMERWGLGYDDLVEVREDLIMVRISGFGQYGPNSWRRGFGSLSNAFSGQAYAAGAAQGRPHTPGFGAADAQTGLAGAFATVVALRERDRSGLGQVIDLGIYETPFTLLGPHAIDYDQLGIVAGAPETTPQVAPTGTYGTKDDRLVFLSGSTQRTFTAVCRAIGRPDLVEDPRFATNSARAAHAAELDHELTATIGTIGCDQLCADATEGNAPIVEVLSIADIFADPHYRERENIAQLDDPELGSVRMQNVVPRLSRTPGAVRFAARAKAADNEAFYAEELGLSADELRELSQDGVI